MIVGLGNDLVRIDRIGRSLERFGERFVLRVFGPRELSEPAAAVERPLALRAAYLAKRYAAKEACAKALGTGFSAGVFWRDIQVVRMADGRPVLVLSGGAQARLEALMPPGHVPRLHLSLSDEPPFAAAVVIAEAVPGTRV